MTLTSWLLLLLGVLYVCFRIVKGLRKELDRKKGVALEHEMWQTRELARQLDPEWASRLDAMVPVVDFGERVVVTNPNRPGCANSIMTREQYERDWREVGWVVLGPEDGWVEPG